MSLNLTPLRHLQPREAALEFGHLLRAHSENTISAQLLAKLEEGSVPASVVCTWLSVAKGPGALADALRQGHSVLVRRYAIRRIGEALRTPQWRKAWNDLGGVAGLLSVFAGLSVQHVKLLARAIGRCSKAQNDEEKQQQVTELLCGLLGSLYPDAPYTTHDERPLHDHYAKMVPACSPGFVRTLLRQNASPLLGHVAIDHLLQTQYGVVRELVLDAIFRGDHGPHNPPEYLQSLLQHMPPISSRELGVSASMSFSLALLRELCKQPGHANFPAERFLPGLVEPLLRRALRKRVDTPVLREIVELAVTYLQHHSGAAQRLSARHGGFIYSVVCCWSRSQELFEDDLITTVAFLRHRQHKGVGQYQSMFRAVSRTKRYALLRLLVFQIKSRDVDVSVEEELRSLRLEKWPCHTFTEMMNDQALSLLRALIRVKPEGSFLPLETGYTILALPRSPGVDYADPALLLTLLERGQTGALERAKRAVDEQKRKASTSREQTDRAFFARSALLWAIASGSLTFYGEIVIWVRRFLRDPLTSKTLYGFETTVTAEGIALLSGIPFDLPQEWSARKVRSRVVEANQVLLAFFETACQALREPSFAAFDWKAPLMLFRNIVEARLREASTLQQALGLSDDELYNTLWTETVKMLVEVERIALQPGHEALGFNLAKGPLCYHHHGYQTLNPPLPSSFRFIDDLARARNDLWQELRPRYHPSTTILPSPWPRGLPIQCLPGSCDVASPSAQGMTPFIVARAEAIVFLESPRALSPCPEDPEIRASIGSFVDSYKLALQIYVLQGPAGEDRAEREARAWAHAMDGLTAERMAQDEAYRTWKARFLQALPEFQPAELDPDQEAVYWPMLPTDVDPQENTEWDPALHQPRKVDSRPLPLTCLDSILAADPNWVVKVSGTFVVPNPHTLGFAPAGIWSLSRIRDMRHAPFTVREGVVASALLFLDSNRGGPDRLLVSPFPTEVDVRYPPLFLDTDFLLRPELHERDAREVLQSLISMVPPSILAALADTTLKALSCKPDGNSEISSLEQMAYGLLSLLLSSDRPQLASDLVLRAIIDRPDASSWHRTILNVGLARKLPARDAQLLLSSFAASIGSKLEEQATLARNRSAENATGDSSPSPPKPIVKVTTVKYLAQILNDADFIPPRFAVDVLSQLLGSASHIDIRVAVVDSLLGMLGGCREESSVPLAQRLLSALETTIPLLGGLSERHLMQEEDWAEAERTGTPPQVYDDGSMASLPPILTQLVNWVALRLKWHQEVFRRIILPIVERSRVSNARWIKVFSSKHQLALESSEVPVLPVKPVLLSKILTKSFDLVPVVILDLYQQFVLSNMAPPRKVASTTSTVRTNGELRASNEGRHWLSLYGNDTDAYNYGGFSLATKLSQEWKPSNVSNGIQLVQVQRLVLEQAEALLKLSDPSFTEWNKFVRNLEPPPGTWHRDKDREAWLANGKPVLERIISRIDSLRTSEWQRDPHRKPVVLPTTFSSRLWLLPYPYGASTKAAKADSLKIFAEELVVLIREIVSRRTTYHGDLEHLTTAASRCPPKDKAQLACHLGSLPSLSSSADVVSLLRVELAESLYRDAILPEDKDVRNTAKAVLATWRASEVEEFRMRGFRISSQLLRNEPGEQGWGFPAEWDLP